uniref:F-box domain-containing protein n=1 Tax=Quercus lobata TaxID=97700 RepID=A0A7N2M8R2_QUELO
MEKKAPLKGAKHNRSLVGSNKAQIFCTISNPKNINRVTKFFEQRVTKEYLASCFGWFVYSYSYGRSTRSDEANWRSLFLLNPISLEKITLPPLKRQESIGYCLLSSSPTEPASCLVILFAKGLPLIMYCHLGDEEWTSLDYYWELKWGFREISRGRWSSLWPKNLRRQLECPVWCNGYLYAATSACKYLVKFHDFQQDSSLEFRIEILEPWLPMSRSRIVFSAEYYLMESCGKLFSIEVKHYNHKHIVGIDIHRFDFSKEKQEHIRQRLKGIVYIFTLANDGHKILYSYNIEDKEISVSSPFLNLPTLQSSEPDIEEVHLPYLPPDLFELIFRSLSFVDYLHFRATCKWFHSVAPSIQWRMASQRFENLSLSPWLTFLEKDGACAFIDPRCGDKYFISLPQPLKASNVLCGTKHGWLLLIVDDESPFLFNPFTQVILPLPFSDSSIEACTSIGISSPPCTSECVLVVILKNKVGFCMLGDEVWTEKFIKTDFLIDDNSPVFYRGAFYCLGQKGNLAILKLNNEEQEGTFAVTFDVLTKPKPPCTGYIQNFLVECDGELLSVFVGPVGKWVRVFKLNKSRMTWIRVESLGDYMLFLSSKSSFSAKAQTPGMENKIYFPRFCGQSIVFYSLETCKYQSFQSEDVVDFYSSREKLDCCWIEPRRC